MSLWDIASTAEWGTGAKAWFERHVLDGLVGVLDMHIETGTGRKLPAAIGCVPWLTMSEIADRLAPIQCCIVANKPSRAADPPRMRFGLSGRGYGFQTPGLARLAD